VTNGQGINPAVHFPYVVFDAQFRTGGAASARRSSGRIWVLRLAFAQNSWWNLHGGTVESSQSLGRGMGAHRSQVLAFRRMAVAHIREQRNSRNRPASADRRISRATSRSRLAMCSWWMMKQIRGNLGGNTRIR
jgi:hypothetical protein